MTNLLFIMADDMRYDTMKYMRHVRRLLIHEGHNFTSCRLNIGLCQPARTGLLTGKYSMTHGVINNNAADIDGGNIDHDNTIGKWLQDAGYTTAMIGKYMNGTGTFNPKPAGWDTWLHVTLPGTQDPYEYTVHNGTSSSQPRIFQMDYLQTQALNFIQSAAEPWFLYLTPTAPHWPYSPRVDNTRKWNRVQWPISDETNISTKPSWIQSKSALTTAIIEESRGVARGQLKEQIPLDEMIAALVAELESSGQLADTTIVFHSDNGIHYGEHRYTGVSTKNTPYEESIHVPLVIRGPAITVGTSTIPTTGQDISKTFAEIAGATPSYALDGVDIRDIINNPSSYTSRGIPHELDDSTDEGSHPPGIGITTSTRKLYRFYTSTSTDKYEMYELDNDPNEQTNVAYDAGHLTERNQLEAALDVLDPYARNIVFPGNSGDYISTPDSASLDITGDIDVRVKVSLADWTPTAAAVPISKSTSVLNQRGWRLRINTTGVLDFQWSTAGTSLLTASTTSPLGMTDGHACWLRATLDVDNGASGRTVTFYQSFDSTDNPATVSWTQIEAITQAGTTSIFSNSTVLELSGDALGTLGAINGRIFAAEVRNGIGGTVVASPRPRGVTRGASSFVDAQGNTWTKQGGTTIE
jgi:N-acetylglucosamine-6-sulfatase